VLFFELEWTALDDAVADALLAEAGGRLAFASHHLRRLRARRPYLLSDAEERVLAETSAPRLLAWQKLFEELTTAITVEIDGEVVPITDAVSRLESPDRAVRLSAMEAIGVAFADGIEVRVSIYNAVLGEKAIDDRLRSHDSWIQSRNIANETSDAAVAAQLTAIRARVDTVQRWFRLKARLLGVDRITTADLVAPLPSDAPPIRYREAQEMVLSAWEQFAPRTRAILSDIFEGQRIDAPIRAGKSGGAFCSGPTSVTDSYVLLNHTEQPWAVITMAHELGHALHFSLCRHQGVLQYETSIPMGETASTFSEMVVIEQLLAQTDDDRLRLRLLAAWIDSAMINVHFSSAANRFEELVHARRRAQGELSADQFTEAWVEGLQEAWGDAVELEDGWRLHWSWMWHMVGAPGYVYAYSFGLLLALACFSRYQELGAPFAESYLEMLAAGGSRSPEELAAMIGFDLNDPGFWDVGLDLLDARVAEAERLADALA
jgi:oligoendopeptidase F